VNYHATLEDAKRFIVWFATNEPDVSDWDRTRYADAVAMVRAIDSLHSRTPHEASIAILCEVAFARMVVADYQWCAGNRAGPDTERGVDDVLERLASCETRFVRQGERSLSLLRDMERVTGELTKK